jgi:putative phosphoesterase
MKIGVISDTHIPERAKAIPVAVLEEFKSADMIIHAGDLVEALVIDSLQAACRDVRIVRGNMDSCGVKERFPEKEIIKVGNFKIAVMHGFGPPANLIELLAEVFKKEAPDIVIFGHSHAALSEKIDNTLYFNPGSPTDKLFSPYNSYGIIEIKEAIQARIVRL